MVPVDFVHELYGVLRFAGPVVEFEDVDSKRKARGIRGYGRRKGGGIEVKGYGFDKRC